VDRRLVSCDADWRVREFWGGHHIVWKGVLQIFLSDLVTLILCRS
jgi:hypothetical protein